MKEIKCPKCQAIKRVSDNVGMVECFCGYVYNVHNRRLKGGNSK